MARKCELCGKGVQSGNSVSHAHNKNRRIWRPNLKKIRGIIEGKLKTVKLCTSCLRTGKVAKV